VAVRNLISVDRVTKAFVDRPILDDVSLGVAEGERIAVVGCNGAGKTTLLHLLGGRDSPDSGRVTAGADVHVEIVSQQESFDEDLTVGEYVVADQAAHEWATQSRVREVLRELLGGFGDDVLARRLSTMSGGERRRAQLARALIADVDVLLLDEPTNHLDVQVIAWLAEHLIGRPRVAVVVVTHDRWFLDAVCDRTWEVVDGRVEEYDGGYSAFVLAKAERGRQAAASEARRRNLLRKELAWLRRGPPARTSKPKFRIDAAQELIASEPPPRDDVQLLAFAQARLGKTVVDMHDVTIRAGGRDLVDHLTWDVGPGQRIGILGANGTGKTSLVRTMLGERRPDEGSVTTGVTVRPAHLSQHVEEIDRTWRVLEAVEQVAARVDLGKDRELTASQLCERMGFGADRQWTPVSDLSGGERRRLQLMRLLMGSPNLLVLDEPTNDFDVETLTALEDLLDGFAGTLVVISHDRYFLERVCDDIYALFGDTRLTSLTGGVDEYLSTLAVLEGVGPPPEAEQRPRPKSGGEQRAQAKELARLERALAKLADEIAQMHEEMAGVATDHAALTDLGQRLRDRQQRQTDLEGQWLGLADS